MERWKDKVAVVTGASSGIGAATAKKLVEKGMIVVGAARRVDKLQELKKQLPANRFHAVECDVGKEQDVIKLFKTVEENCGRVDVLINNAGVAHQTPFTDANGETLTALFATNCVGPMLCTREALKLMKSKNIDAGYIMFTNSLAGHTVFPSSPGMVLQLYGYSASKFALRALVEGLRQELRAQGSRIRVGEVSPGAVATEIVDSFVRKCDEQSKSSGVADQTAKAFKKGFAQLDIMQPEDIADAFVYMLSAPERADVNEIIVNHMNKKAS